MSSFCRYIVLKVIKFDLQTVEETERLIVRQRCWLICCVSDSRASWRTLLGLARDSARFQLVFSSSLICHFIPCSFINAVNSYSRASIQFAASQCAHGPVKIAVAYILVSQGSSKITRAVLSTCKVTKHKLVAVEM